MRMIFIILLLFLITHEFVRTGKIAGKYGGYQEVPMICYIDISYDILLVGSPDGRGRAIDERFSANVSSLPADRELIFIATIVDEDLFTGFNYSWMINDDIRRPSPSSRSLRYTFAAGGQYDVGVCVTATAPQCPGYTCMGVAVHRYTERDPISGAEITAPSTTTTDNSIIDAELEPIERNPKRGKACQPTRARESDSSIHDHSRGEEKTIEKKDKKMSNAMIWLISLLIIAVVVVMIGIIVIIFFDKIWRYQFGEPIWWLPAWCNVGSFVRLEHDSQSLHERTW